MEKFTLKRAHPNKTSTQVGRGGTRGKTSGRGGKGQTARAGNKRRPALRDAIKKIPKLRGRGMNSFKSFQPIASIITLTRIDAIVSQGAVLTRTTAVELGLVSKKAGKIPAMKILGTGKITKKIFVEGILTSASAKAAIEAAGGTVK